MPTTTSQSELAEIRDQLVSYIEKTGQSITELAIRADVPRDFLYRFINDSYKHSPSFEYICRTVRAIGKRVVTTPEK